MHTKQSARSIQFLRFCAFVGLKDVLHYAIQQPEQITTNLRQVQKDYGLACAKLFRVLFIQWQPGGCTVDGKPFKSQWRLKESAAKDFIEVLDILKQLPDPTATEALRLMEDRGYKPEWRIKIWDDTMTTYEDFIVDREDRTAVLEMKRAERNKKKDFELRRQALYYKEGV